MKVTVIPIIIGALGTFPKDLVRGARNVENQRTSKDHPNYSIAEIVQNSN